MSRTIRSNRGDYGKKARESYKRLQRQALMKEYDTFPATI